VPVFATVTRKMVLELVSGIRAEVPQTPVAPTPQSASVPELQASTVVVTPAQLELAGSVRVSVAVEVTGVPGLAGRSAKVAEAVVARFCSDEQLDTGTVSRHIRGFDVPDHVV